MNEVFDRRARRVVAAMAAVLLLAGGTRLLADTKTVTFDWEDGTSGALATFANTPDTTSVTPTNVSSGHVTDFGPSGDPFETPMEHDVSPFEGSRMLQTQLDIDDETNSGTDGAVTVAWVANLDPGDIIEFSFYGWDPPGAMDRSPSVFPNAIYTNSASLGSFDGFAVPLQPFANFVGGNGWEELFLDATGDETEDIVKEFTFDPDGSIVPAQGSGSNSDAADALMLDANFFYQSLTESPPEGSGDGTEELYVDLATIKVTSSNPDAAIYLPDGSITLVNEPAGLPGDFNGDGWVDAADYTEWRDNLGSDFDLSGNGDENGTSMGVVDGDDYTLWVDSFGTHAEGGSSLSAGAVPEPASVALAVIGLFGCAILRRGRRR